VAKLTIRLVTNPVTKKREVDVAYESEPDALPMEHEQDHRRLVEKLVGPIKALQVERGGEGTPADLPAGAEALAEREKLRQ
jgi:hypothetical protein